MQKPDLVEKLIILNLPHPRGLRRELAHNPKQQENSAYARFVLARSAASNASGTNHRVAFQTSGVPKGKAGD